jgi:hypothetical protein
VESLRRENAGPRPELVKGVRQDGWSDSNLAPSSTTSSRSSSSPTIRVTQPEFHRPLGDKDVELETDLRADEPVQLGVTCLQGLVIVVVPLQQSIQERIGSLGYLRAVEVSE